MLEAYSPTMKTLITYLLLTIDVLRNLFSTLFLETLFDILNLQKLDLTILNFSELSSIAGKVYSIISSEIVGEPSFHALLSNCDPNSKLQSDGEQKS